MACFLVKVSCLWMLICVPGLIVVTSYKAFGRVFGFSNQTKDATKDEDIACYESIKEYSSIVHKSRYWIEGVGVLIVGSFGIIGNMSTILALSRKKRACMTCWRFGCNDSNVAETRSSTGNSSLSNPRATSIMNMNDCFYKLIISLAAVDVILILYIMGEISIIGAFMDNIQPIWFKIAYPYLIYPFRNIAQTASIFMVVAISTERYRAVCHPLKHRQEHYKYTIPVLLISIGVRVPRFFELQIVHVENGTLDYDTTNLSEDPTYIQFNAYWNELIVTGILPLILLVIMNFRIYMKIRVSASFAQKFGRYGRSIKGSHKSLRLKLKSGRSSNTTGSRIPSNRTLKQTSGPFLSIPSANRNGSVGIEMADVSQACLRNIDHQAESASQLTREDLNTNSSVSNIPSEIIAVTELQNDVEPKPKVSTDYAEKNERHHMINTRKCRPSYDATITRSRKRKEKSTIILVAIVLVFILCHTYRLTVEVYRLSYPENILKDTFEVCFDRQQYVIPFLLLIFHYLHFLFLTINSSVNFIIYCGVDQEFRRQVSRLCCFSVFKCERCQSIPSPNNV